MANPDCEKCGGDGWYIIPAPDHLGEHAYDVIDCDCEVKKSVKR